MADDFLFHKVGEEEKEEIRSEAKEIMDSFSRKLSKIDKKVKEPLIEKEEFEREEGNPRRGDDDFRELMLENAPNKSKDFILGGKKTW